MSFIDAYHSQIHDKSKIPIFLTLRFKKRYHVLNKILSLLFYLFILLIWICLKYNKCIVITIMFINMIIIIPISLFLFSNHIISNI